MRRRAILRPAMTLPEAVDAAVAAAGDTELIADGQRATLRELTERADALAGRLAAAGAGPRDHVAVMLPNGLAYAEALLAAVRLGAVAVPLDHQLPARELAAVSESVDLRALLSATPQPGAGDGRADGVRVGEEWLVAGGGAPRPVGRSRPARADVGAVFFTSGTTGRPKPVPLTHHQLVRPLVALERLHAAFFSGPVRERARSLATVTRRHGTRLLRAAGRQTWLTTSPFRSMAGHEVLLGSLLLGHHLVTESAFHPRRTLELVSEHQVNVLAGTPAMLELLLRAARTSQADTSSLLVIGIGGGPASPSLVDRARERFGCAVTIGYGSTELGGGILATRIEDTLETQARTVGRPFPGAEVRVLDEHGEPAPPGVAGELWCRSAPDGESEDRWLATGDLAAADAAGNVRILGRKDDLIVRGGANVHPVEVEQVIESLPEVDRCAVFGVPVREDRQVWAYVVASAEAGVDTEAVRRHCRAHLAPSKQPDRVRLVGELPVNEQGEIRRQLLREQAMSGSTAAGRSESA